MKPLLTILFLLTSVAMAVAEPTVHTQIIGHRGGAPTAPENTLAALKQGYADGADGVEFDFRSTNDGWLVLSHDATMKRCAGVDVEVFHQSFAELRKLDVGSWGPWKDKGFSEKIPTLDEALATVPAGRKVFMHCYTGSLEMNKVQKAVISAGLKPEQVVLICFELAPCKAFKKLMPECKVYWLAGYKKPTADFSPPTAEDLIKIAKDAGVDGLDIAYQFPIDSSFVAKIHGAGLELHVWTVNDAAIAKKLVDAGVDSITTDKAQELIEQLGLKKPH